MSIKKSTRILVKTSLILSLSSLIAGTASAAAFQLWEQDAAGVGDYHAGAIAGADSAATGYYNPAGLVRIKHPQISTGGVGVHTDIKFKGTETTTDILNGLPPIVGTQSGKAQGGGWNAVPNFHFATPLTKYLYFGFGITTPFGLETNWSKRSVVAYSATKSQIQTINLSPSFGLDLTHGFSFGAGLDYQYLHGEFDEVVGNSNPLAQPQTNNMLSVNKGQDWALGYHGGFLYQFNNRTRIGLSYRSRMIHHLKGSSTLTNIAANTRTAKSGDVRSSITLPPTTMLGFYQGITSKFSMMGSVMYTQWNVITDLKLKNVADVNGQKVTAVTPLHYKNTWNFALGGQYQLSRDWLVKCGGGYDLTPTTSKRDIRLPDGNHLALALGGQFKPTKNLAFDFGWTHLFIQKVKVNKTVVVVKNPSLIDEATTDGKVSGAADVLGLQLTWTIV
jgi:long-chain fatty acid transport protein